MRSERPRFSLLSVILIAATIVTMGCATRLENTTARPSPYKGNAGLYIQDVAITDTSDALKDFLGWEMRWRTIVTADVTAFADKVRGNLATWNAAAIRTRDAYAVDPSVANGAAFRGAIAELQQALVEATLFTARNKALK